MTDLEARLRETLAKAPKAMAEGSPTFQITYSLTVTSLGVTQKDFVENLIEFTLACLPAALEHRAGCVGLKPALTTISPGYFAAGIWQATPCDCGHDKIIVLAEKLTGGSK